LLATFYDPIRARLHVVTMLGLRGDAGEANVVAQFIDEPRFVLFQKINDGLHLFYVAGK
jgi:hypothetical protein